MDIHQSEEEQIESIKKWWNENSKSVITGLVLAAAVALGWQSWSNSQAQKQQAAAQNYYAMQQQDGDNKPELTLSQGKILIADYPDSIYATFASLLMAKTSYQQNESENALSHLQWVIDHSDSQPYLRLAAQRKASVLLELARHEDALSALQSVITETPNAVEYELLGDIYQAMNKNSEAKENYQNVLSLESPNRALVQMKIEALPAEE